MNSPEPNSTRPVPTAPHHRAPRRTSSRWGLACQIFPAVGLVATVVVMLEASRPWADEVAIGDLVATGAFIVWGILPFLGLSALIILTDRLARPRLWLFAVAGPLLLAYTAWSLAGFFRSESSTSALIFVTLPLIQWAAVAATGLAVWMITVLVRRGSSTRAS